MKEPEKPRNFNDDPLTPKEILSLNDNPIRIDPFVEASNTGDEFLLAMNIKNANQILSSCKTEKELYLCVGLLEITIFASKNPYCYSFDSAIEIQKQIINTTLWGKLKNYVSGWLKSYLLMTKNIL